MSKEKVGTLDGRTVYYSESNGWLIRSGHSQVLLDMSKDEIGDFLTQKVRFLGQYDYELSKFGR